MEVKSQASVAVVVDHNDGTADVFQTAAKLCSFDLSSSGWDASAGVVWLMIPQDILLITSFKQLQCILARRLGA